LASARFAHGSAERNKKTAVRARVIERLSLISGRSRGIVPCHAFRCSPG